MQKECIIWGAKSMNYLKSEEEVDKLIEEMRLKTKTNYITQGVAFNKNCPRQMGLLKNALMGSASFSGLIKELLALKYLTDDSNNNNIKIDDYNNTNSLNKEIKTVKKEEVIIKHEDTTPKTIELEQKENYNQNKEIQEVIADNLKGESSFL